MSAITSILTELESLGTAQNRKVFARHGVTGNHFGVSYANLDKLARRYRPQPELAAELWASGWLDARTLATKIAQAELPKQTLESWVRDVNDRVLSGDLTALVARTPHGKPLAEKWIDRSPARSHWMVVTGWGVVGALADPRRSPDTIPANSWFRDRLATIQSGIGESPNMVRHTMNNALIGIGCSNSVLRKAAENAARKIGLVEVDHGETGCKTPEAMAYIARTWARREK